MGPRFSRAIFRNSFGIWIVIEAGLGLEVTGLLGALAGLRDEEGVYTFVAVLFHPLALAVGLSLTGSLAEQLATLAVLAALFRIGGGQVARRS